MKRSSNVKRSSMDKSLKLGKIIPFAAFGGISSFATQESKTEGYIFLTLMNANQTRQSYLVSAAKKLRAELA
uniref:hypothetical protein n=1 Tax=Vibrio diabolicus TaxID=50719 RepID=UPI00178378D1|nr:hypothetical protein [Vibrio diabolicus]